MQPPARAVAVLLVCQKLGGLAKSHVLPCASHKTLGSGWTFALANAQALTLGVHLAASPNDINYNSSASTRLGRDRCVWIVSVTVIFLLYIELYTPALFLQQTSHTLRAFLWPADLLLFPWFLLIYGHESERRQLGFAKSKWWFSACAGGKLPQSCNFRKR